jgi:prepilin signal peptidase PulO-like enzyme (type II secretory pathway)
MTTALLISQIVLLLLAFAFGSSIASFLGVVIERGKTGESITGRSHCACGRPLKRSENIPVIGWLRIMGRTRCCNTRLPIWYLIFEIGLGLVAAGALALVIF